MKRMNEQTYFSVLVAPPGFKPSLTTQKPSIPHAISRKTIQLSDLFSYSPARG